MACILAVWWLASCICGAGQLATAHNYNYNSIQLSRGLELGVSILIADCARVLLMTYPVRTYDPSTTSRHFGAETKSNHNVEFYWDLI